MRSFAAIGFLILALMNVGRAAAQEVEAQATYREPSAAAALSFFLPGVGQAWLDEPKAGAPYAAAGVIGALIGTGILQFGLEGNDQDVFQASGLALWVFSATAAAFDAFHRAERINDGNGWYLSTLDTGDYLRQLPPDATTRFVLFGGSFGSP